MENQKFIYELIDHSDDERYYSLGVFLDKESALAYLEDDEPPANECDLDFVIIKVIAHPIGFHPYKYLNVASRSWERNYGESEEKWIVHPIENESSTQ